MSAYNTDAEKQSSEANKFDERVEKLEPSDTHQTYYEPTDINALSEEHRTYLLKRHGTLELDPIPSFGDADPYNWSTTKVRGELNFAKPD